MSLPAADLPQLTPDSAQEYWNARWERDLTRWRTSERSTTCPEDVQQRASDLLGLPPCASGPFPRSVLEGLRAGAAILHPGDKEAGTKELAGRIRTVFVPLCGDTAAVSYFAQWLLRTATAAGEYLVLGVDLSEKAVRQNIELNFAGAQVITDGATMSEERNDSSGEMKAKFVRSTRQTAPAGGEGGVPTETIHYTAVLRAAHPQTRVRVELVVGNLFTLEQMCAAGVAGAGATRVQPEPPLVPHHDAGALLCLVYDRGSMVAVPPVMRGDYARAVRTISRYSHGVFCTTATTATTACAGTAAAASAAIVLLESPYREESVRAEGPPFAIPPGSMAGTLIADKTPTTTPTPTATTTNTTTTTPTSEGSDGPYYSASEGWVVAPVDDAAKQWVSGAAVSCADAATQLAPPGVVFTRWVILQQAPSA